MANRDIDAAIREMIMERWQKTAMIIMKSDEVLRKAGVKASYEEIAERIAVLAAQGDIENQGDLSLWRNSEVRLPHQRSVNRVPFNQAEALLRRKVDRHSVELRSPPLPRSTG